MTMVPEAWQNDHLMNEKKKAWYRWSAYAMEPWDGPGESYFVMGHRIEAVELCTITFQVPKHLPMFCSLHFHLSSVSHQNSLGEEQYASMNKCVITSSAD